MKFFINNNTTYSYSCYATRPKWLVEALFKKPLSQKEFKRSSSCLRKSLPITINKIGFAPWPETGKIGSHQKSKRQENIGKKEFLTQSRFKRNDFLPQKTVSVLQMQTKNQIITPRKLKGKAFFLPKTTNVDPKKKVYQHLFQAKELLCWTSDLSFFNLRGYFSNILKVLQICRFAIRNNKKILFIKDSSSSDAQGKLLNPWLVQYERNSVPITLSNLFNKSYLNPTQPLLSPRILRLSKDNNLGKTDLHKMTNTIKHSLLQQEKSRGEPAPHFLSKKDCLKTNLLGEHSNKVAEDDTLKNRQSNPSYHRRYYQLSGLLNSCLYLNLGKNSGYKASHFKNPFVFTLYTKDQKTPPNPWAPAFFLKTPFLKTDNEQKKALFKSALPYGQADVFQEQSLENYNKYDLSSKTITIRIDNIIKLWIKEAQTMSQQTASGLTIPLAGFLTNSKTTFNTVYNLSNYDFYSSINSNLKTNSLLNKGICKIKTNRLEKVNFQKNRHLSFSSKPSVLNSQRLAFTTLKESTRNKDGLKIEPSTKSFKYETDQKQAGRKQVDNPGVLAFNFPKVFKSSKLATTKRVKKGKDKEFVQYKDSNANIVVTSKNQRQKGFDQKGWWIDYSNSHNYLSLTPGTRSNVFFKDSEPTTRNEKTKRLKPLEYCFFGDVLTWQSKCQKSSSMFYFSTFFSKNKDNIITYLRKQIVLEKRGPVVLKKKPPFFTYFKKQLQMSKHLELKLKESLKCKKKKNRIRQAQTKGSFLKKRQFLSTLAKFIVFYLNSHNILLKNQIIQIKKSETYIYLPSLPTVKTKVKITLNPKNFHRYGYRSIYGYNLALRTPLFSRKNKGALQSRSRKSVLLKAVAPSSTQGDQKNKQLIQKKQRLRPFLFYRYYKTIIALNHLNQYKMFAKTPFVNNQLADIIFFINPEKNHNLVNQANSLRIPTVGIISGNVGNAQGHQGNKDFCLKESVYYPILGNPMSSIFTRVIISLIVKFLRVEKSKNTFNRR